MDKFYHRSHVLRLLAALIVLLSSFVLLARPPSAIAAADIVVNSDADIEADDGACTLREAITAANNDTASGAEPGECAAGSADGPDVITFDDDYTITLGSTLPTVSSPMTITGNGPNNTIIQASACNPVDPQPPDCTPAGHRVFFISSSGDLTLERLTVRHGHAANSTAGGGIANSGGQLTVTGSAFSGNAAGGHGGAIYSSGGLDVTDSTFSGNWAGGDGGAIFGPDLQVIDSAFFGNTADRNGGAIYSTWDLEVTGSTFSGNEGYGGGAIALEGTEHTITNNTFSGNIASAVGGAIWNAEDTAATTVVNSTFYDNEAPYGSTIFRSYGTLTLSNSISADQNDEDNCYGGITDGGGNFSDDDSCTGTATPGLALEPLGDYGGPTLTHALASGSPAINYAGINAAACPATDQRGNERPQGGGCDVGAYEVVSCDGSPYDVSNDAELTEAIRCINEATTGEQTINIENDFTVYTLNDNYLGTPRLTYSADKVIIDGHDFILTGDGNGRFFRLSSGTVEISDITLTGGSAEFGGAIYAVSTDLTVTNSTFSDNSGNDYGGGAIYQELGELIVIDSTFTGNKAYDDGGAIGTDETEVTVTGSTFAKNSGDDGGAISFSWGTGEVTNSTFSENDAFYAGGAIEVDPGEVVVTNSTFYKNTAGTSGNGSIFYTRGDLTVHNSLMVSQSDGIACELSGFGEIHDGGGNLSDNASCHGATTQPLMVMPLADNGGPTQTHALLEGSPAIDHVATGNPAPPTDQRGVSRPQRNGIDAGAFELEPPDDPCPPVDGNAIANFCFEDGSAPWTFHSDGHGLYNITPFDVFAGNGAAEVKITVPGSNVQFYQNGISLQGDTTYELTFAAKSSDGRDLSVFVHKHGANYANYGLSNEVFDLTADWQEFSVEFTTPDFGSVNDARLRFWLAPFDAAGTVYSIDRVALRPAGGDPLPPPPPPPDPEVPAEGHCNDPVDGNLIANPGYEDDTFAWSFFTNGSANFSAPENVDAYECDANARVQINTSGNNVQLFQTGIELEPNTHYRLRLAARATGADAIQLFVQRHSAPFSNYGLNGLKLDLTSEWQVFVVDFTTSGFASTTTDTRLRFWLAPYDTAGAVFEFDDVVLTPVVVDPPREGGADTTGATTRATPKATRADSHLISGYFIDNNHTDRLGGGYVGTLDGCRNARASQSRLWPANNKLWPVTIGNIGTPQSVQITSVWQDEPVGREPDAVISTGGALHLRAERDADAGADGRVYTIQFRATYADGQSCNGIVTVGVPLSNRRGVEARSGGELFTSTDR